MTSILITSKSVVADTKVTITRGGEIVGNYSGFKKSVMCEGNVFAFTGDGDYWEKYFAFLNGDRIFPPVICRGNSNLSISVQGKTRIYDINTINLWNSKPRSYTLNDGWIMIGSGSEYINQIIEQVDDDATVHVQRIYELLSTVDIYTNNEIRCLSPSTDKFVSISSIIKRNLLRLLYSKVTSLCYFSMR